MAMVAVAAGKGAPGVTTTAVMLAAVWPRPVLLAECDPAGGDLVYRFPAAAGGALDPRRGLLSLAAAARHGLRPGQVWEHTQRLPGGLDVLTGVTTAEQGAGLGPLWGQLGTTLGRLPQADVIADCGRLDLAGPYCGLLAQAAAIVLVTRHDLGQVVRLRERIPALLAALASRGPDAAATVSVLLIAAPRRLPVARAEVAGALWPGGGRVTVASGLAYDPRAARQLRGDWGVRLDSSLLARTARAVAGQLAGAVQPFGVPGWSGGPERAGHDGQPAGATAAAGAG
jgi:hypothetical protein